MASHTHLDPQQLEMSVTNHPSYPRLDRDYRAVVEKQAVVKWPRFVTRNQVILWLYNYLYNDGGLPDICVSYHHQDVENNFI